MSINREVTIICNECYSSYSFVNTKSFRTARAAAAENGWVREGKLDFCSPEHREDYYNRQAVNLTTIYPALRFIRKPYDYPTD